MEVDNEVAAPVSNSNKGEEDSIENSEQNKMSESTEDKTDTSMKEEKKRKKKKNVVYFL